MKRVHREVTFMANTTFDATNTMSSKLLYMIRTVHIFCTQKSDRMAILIKWQHQLQSSGRGPPCGERNKGRNPRSRSHLHQGKPIQLVICRGGSYHGFASPPPGTVCPAREGKRPNNVCNIFFFFKILASSNLPTKISESAVISHMDWDIWLHWKSNTEETALDLPGLSFWWWAPQPQNW